MFYKNKSKQTHQRNNNTNTNQVSTGTSVYIDLDEYKTSKLVHSGLIVPDRFETNLQYGLVGYQLIGIAGTGAATGSITLNANSVFEPRSGQSGQPMGYDELVALYSNYRVLDCELHFELTRLSDPAVVTISPSTITGNPASVALAQEAPYCTIVPMSTGLCNYQTTVKMSTHRIFGVPKNSVRYENNFAAVTSTNPTSQWYWVINGRSSDGTQTILMWIDVRMVYHVEFFNKRNLTQSS